MLQIACIKGEILPYSEPLNSDGKSRAVRGNSSFLISTYIVLLALYIIGSIGDRHDGGQHTNEEVKSFSRRAFRMTTEQ